LNGVTRGLTALDRHGLKRLAMTKTDKGRPLVGMVACSISTERYAHLIIDRQKTALKKLSRAVSSR
jgi:hypothetical protein